MTLHESVTNGKAKFIFQSLQTRFINIHGSKYSYEKFIYKATSQKSIILCPVHGDFSQSAQQHLKGYGCPKCGINLRGEKRRVSFIKFEERANLKHNNKYEYIESSYTKLTNKVTIICKEHGEFSQLSYAHLTGHGCLKCANHLKGSFTRHTKEDFIQKAHKKHGNIYSYKNVTYQNDSSEVEIICPKHGSFMQEVSSHINQGAGCPKCINNCSKAEVQLNKFINNLGIATIQSDRSLISPMELDIVIPSHKIAIEYNGLRWHSEQFGKGKDYHVTKTRLCKEAGYHLIHIFEDDFINTPTKILKYLQHILGKTTEDKVFARKTKVIDVSYKEANAFLEEHHIQGEVKQASCFLGLVMDDKLLSVSAFKKGQSNTSNKDSFELIRHATKGVVIGALGKTVKEFSKRIHNKIFTYCDDSFFTGGSYLKAGFKIVSNIPPDYKYVIKGNREHKFLWRREAIKKKLPHVYSMKKSEKEMMLEAQIYRIWDCGKTRYEYLAS